MNELIKQALLAREQAYAPYSKYRVGAALKTANGKIYTGCNIENAAYSPSCCAERIAFYNAISNGEIDFDVIAVVGGLQNEITATTPCGVCRQVMAEFCDLQKFQIVMATSEEEYEVVRLGDLLPKVFSL
ncbi:MAG: cytidine deaminase [Lachnoclostridium sp.]|jgi:cytidine deaminase|nr:cytidine deaminase [Lachnoclostridium sp.]